MPSNRAGFTRRFRTVLRMFPGVGHMFHYAVPEEAADDRAKYGWPPPEAHRIRSRQKRSQLALC